MYDGESIVSERRMLAVSGLLETGGTLCECSVFVLNGPGFFMKTSISSVRTF